jgi:VWFA-related protein
MALPGIAGGRAAPQKPQAPETPVIRVGVDMVSLPVVVTTREGKRVTDLEQKDFQVFEEGIEQTIAGFSPTEEPITVALALDTSGSTQLKLARIQDEAIHFVNELHPDDSVAVMAFADDVSLLEDFSIDRDRNARGIKESRTAGWTVLFEAVWLALEEVLKPIRERKALILFTDGVDTRSRKVSEHETIELAKESDATLYCIYFNTDRDVTRPLGGPTVGGIPLPGPTGIFDPRPGSGTQRYEYARGRSYLLKLAEFSGGYVFDALEMDDLRPAFEQIARELASQYSIGYYPTNTKKDGKFRKVEVRLKKPGLVARTKKGYYAKKRPS